MVDFITKDKKVIPINNKKGISSDKVGIEKKKILTDSSPEIVKAKALLKQKMENNPKNEIGLTKHRVQRHFGFDNGSMGSEEQREIGNNIIAKVVKLSKEQSQSDLDDYVIHDNRVFNDYNGIQRIFANSEKNVEELIEGTKDSDPKKWKWLSPIPLETDVPSTIPIPNKKNTVRTNPKYKLTVFDSHNNSFITHGYKNEIAITTMTPEQFMQLADPAEATYEKFIGNSQNSVKTIDELTEKFKKGAKIDTPFLDANKDLKVTGHEGRHRALGAMRAGITKIPVYVYGGSSFSFTDQNLKDIARFPRTALSPDFPR